MTYEHPPSLTKREIYHFDVSGLSKGEMCELLDKLNGRRVGTTFKNDEMFGSFICSGFVVLDSVFGSSYCWCSF